MLDVTAAMEEIDAISQEFSFFRLYEPPERLKMFLLNFLDGAAFSVVEKG